MALLDTLFWAIVLAALFEFGLIAAAGQPRGFVLLTAAGGVELYLAALGETMLEVFMRLLQVLCKAETRRIRPADALSNGGKTAVQSGKNSVLTKNLKRLFLFRKRYKIKPVSV